MTPPAARRRSQFIDAVIDDYAAAHSTPPDADQLELQRITQDKTGRAAVMQIGDDQAALMEMLVRAMGATRAVEIGTFTGYSALAVARGLGPGGRLLCCDVSQEWTSIARAAWQKAGVAERIELRVGPGLETLRSLPPGEQFDFAFIDADKTGYAQYYEEVLVRLRPGGLILLDNTLQGGHVVGGLADDEDVAAIRSLNDAIAADPRVKLVLIPIGDGVTTWCAISAWACWPGGLAGVGYRSAARSETRPDDGVGLFEVLSSSEVSLEGPPLLVLGVGVLDADPL